MDLTSPHPMQRYWNLASAVLQVQALEYAMTSGLLNALKTSSTCTKLAKQLHFDPKATAVLMELLWSMDILERKKSEGGSVEATLYTLTPSAKRYLLDDADQGYAKAWRFRTETLNTCGQNLPAYLEGRLEGNDFAAVQSEQAWAHAAQGQIAQEQRTITAPAVAQLLREIEIPFRGRFLDLGGGPGFVSIELALQYPEMTGTVFDLPSTAEVANSNIKAAGLQERLDTLGGNAATDDLGGPYDLIWCSSVLHFLPDIDTVLHRMIAALKPGGLLVCAHAEIANTAAEALQTLPFYMPLMLRGHYVPHQDELPTILQRHNLTLLDSRQLLHAPMTPIWVHTGRKPV